MARGRKTNFAPVRERLIQIAVLEHWLKLGMRDTLVAAIPNAFAHGQAGLTPGLPDLLVITPKLGSKTGYIELKAEDGKLSNDQLAIRAIMAMQGIPYAVTYGRDQPIQVLEDWGAVRTRASAA